MSEDLHDNLVSFNKVITQDIDRIQSLKLEYRSSQRTILILIIGLYSALIISNILFGLKINEVPMLCLIITAVWYFYWFFWSISQTKKKYRVLLRKINKFIVPGRDFIRNKLSNFEQYSPAITMPKIMFGIILICLTFVLINPFLNLNKSINIWDEKWYSVILFIMIYLITGMFLIGSIALSKIFASFNIAEGEYRSKLLINIPLRRLFVFSYVLSIGIAFFTFSSTVYITFIFWSATQVSMHFVGIIVFIQLVTSHLSRQYYKDVTMAEISSKKLRILLQLKKELFYVNSSNYGKLIEKYEKINTWELD